MSGFEGATVAAGAGAEGAEAGVDGEGDEVEKGEVERCEGFGAAGRVVGVSRAGTGVLVLVLVPA